MKSFLDAHDQTYKINRVQFKLVDQYHFIAEWPVRSIGLGLEDLLQRLADFVAFHRNFIPTSMRVSDSPRCSFNYLLKNLQCQLTHNQRTVEVSLVYASV